MSAALAGRTALVTGASRGIGLAIAHTFVASGARVAMLARSASELDRRATELGEYALPFVCDITDAQAVQAIAAKVCDRFAGAPDILVNNAGLFFIAGVEETQPEDALRALQVNTLAPLLFASAFFPI